jgi:hypothetical protein
MRKFLFLGPAFAGIAAIVAVLLLAQGSPGLANPYPSTAPANAARALDRTYGAIAAPTSHVTQPQPTPGSTPSALRPPQGQLAGPRRVVPRNLSPAPKVESRSGQPRLIPRLAPKLKRDPRAQAPQANALDRPSTGTSPSRSAPDIVSGFEGLDSTDNLFGLSPPDPQVAVGPNHVVEFVNVTGRIYTKAGVPVSTFSLDDFFGVFSGAFSSDPRVIYDDVHHRFFASFVDLDYGANFGDLFLAISQTDDPTGAWNQYVASFPGAVPDYPGIGVTDDKFTLSYNLFGLFSSNFIGEQTLVVQKSDVMAGDVSPGASFFPINANRFTVRPAHSLSATNDQYLTTFDILSNGGSLPLTEMTVIRITGTPDSGDVTEASATDLPVLTQDIPPASVTAGPGYIEGDFRMLEAVWRDNSLWSSASAACIPPGDGGARSCAHLIEVATLGAPSVLQDIMFGAVNQYYSWPAIRTDSAANLYVSFTDAHSGMFASAQVAGRLSTDPLGTITGSCLLKAGQVVHNSGRWGDYLGAAVDPADPSTVWVVGEYAKNDGFVDWGTYIGSLSYTTGGTCPQAPIPPTPTPSPTPAPAKGNDNFAAAAVIPEPLPYTNTQNSAGSTTEPGEASPCGNIASTDWYSFTPSGNQTVIANTFGSNYDTVLAVYTGTSLGALTLVGCNDQFGGNQSQVQFSAAAGTSYHIQAGGYFGQTGALVLNLAAAPPPPANDNFADAIVIPEPLPYTNTQSTAGATTEAGEPSSCSGIATVWYRFTPSSNQTLVADTFGSNYYPVLVAVYTGPDLNNLTLVGCNYQRVRFTAGAGITYHIQAGSYGQTGNLTFNLTQGPIPLPTTPSPTSTPSPTPTPSHTPTPAPTPTPCPPALCVVDFSIGTDLLGGAGGACNSSGTPTNVCNVALGATFNVNFYLNSLPTAFVDSYAGYDVLLQYTGLTATGTQQSLHLDYWPECAFPASNFSSPGQIFAGCSIGVSQSDSTYTGRIAAPEFTCTADGAITLVHGEGHTDIVNYPPPIAFSEGSDESLTIHCVAPLAYPGDTDGDGCPDAKEQGMNQMLGGRRNFLNPWDYFNPTHDGKNRIDDILAVIQHFGKNLGDPGYDTKYDRTALGPNSWNLGPPNGQIRVADIIAEIRQFGHDCA